MTSSQKKIEFGCIKTKIPVDLLESVRLLIVIQKLNKKHSNIIMENTFKVAN